MRFNPLFWAVLIGINLFTACQSSEPNPSVGLESDTYFELAERLRGRWVLKKYFSNETDLIDEHRITVSCDFKDYDGRKGKVDVIWWTKEGSILVSYDYLFYGENGIILENPNSKDDPNAKYSFVLRMEMKNEYNTALHLIGTEFSSFDKAAFSVNIHAERPA